MAKTKDDKEVYKIYSNSDFVKTYKNSSQEKENLAYVINYGLTNSKKGTSEKFSYNNASKKQIPIKLKRNIQKFSSNFLEEIYFSNQSTLIIKIQATSPYVSGLGGSHVTETGIELHHTFGVPYLKGSAIKGMFRAWCNKAGIENEDVKLLFGESDNDGFDTVQGALVFYDVLFDDLELYPDIMTPHEEDLKGNLQTNPINFLRVDFLSKAHLIITLRNGVNRETIDMIFVGNWLIQALKEYGLGAKIAMGYGRFKGEIDEEIGDILQKKKEKIIKIKDKKLAAKKEANRRAQLSPEELAVEEALDDIKKAKTNQYICDNKIKQTKFMNDFKDNAKVINALYQFYQEEGYFKIKKGKMKEKADHLLKIYNKLY